MANNGSVSSENENENFMKNIQISKNFYTRNVYHINSDIKNKSVQVTNPSLIMFNAIVNKGFKSERKLELGMIAEDIAKNKLPFEKHVYPNNGITIQVKKVIGRYGRLQPGFTITNAYAKTGTNIFNSSIFMLEFSVQLSFAKETVNAIVSLFTNGKIKISGGYLNQRAENVNNEEYFEAQPELIREYIIDNYTNKEKFLRNAIEFNNVVSEIRFNKGFNLTLIASMTHGRDYTVKYNPELSSNMFIKHGDFDYVISPRGVVKIQGLTEHDDIEESYEFIVSFINSMIEFEKQQKPDAKGRIKYMLQNKGNVNKNRLIKQKNFDPTKPAPEITRRGTSCPLERQPYPYSMQGKCLKDRCYVKPNPQGQPCCYKIPRTIKYSESKVKAVYNRANVKVPENVRKIFNFGTGTNSKLNNTSHKNLTNIVVKLNSKLGLKIGSRQCSRYSKVALVDIAHRLGLPVTPSMDKPKLCELIQTVAKNITNTNNVTGAYAVKFKNQEKVYVVTGDSLNTLKIGGRVAKTIKHADLSRFAFKLGARPPAGLTIAQLCKVIYDQMISLRPARKSPTPNPTPSPVKSKKSPTVNVNVLATKFRIKKNLIKEDIKKFLGDAWISKRGVTNSAISNKAEEIYKNIGTSIGSGNLELKTSEIKEFKKDILREWKDKFDINFIKSKYANIPYNNIRQAVQEFAIKRNSEGKFPKHTNVLKYADVRSKIARSPPRKLKASQAPREEI